MNHFSDDFEMCGMMISNEKMNMVFSGKIPGEYNRNAYNFVATPGQSDINIADRMFLSAWEIARQKDCPDETIDGIIYSLIHYYKFLKTSTTTPTNTTSHTTGRCSTGLYSW